jgi:hypothetical protein
MQGALILPYPERPDQYVLFHEEMLVEGDWLGAALSTIPLLICRWRTEHHITLPAGLPAGVYVAVEAGSGGVLGRARAVAR